MRLTRKQREALLMLHDMKDRYPEESAQGATISDRTWFSDYKQATWPAFINWRTAYALRDKGLVTTEYIGPDEGAAITLTAEGDPR